MDGQADVAYLGGEQTLAVAVAVGCPIVRSALMELRADGPMHQRRGHRGVDAAGQPADHGAVANTAPDRFDGLLDDAGMSPQRSRPARLVEEVLEHLLTTLGVDFGQGHCIAVPRPVDELEQAGGRKPNLTLVSSGSERS